MFTAVGNLRKPLILLGITAAVFQSARGKHCTGEKGFQNQAFTQLFHQHHGVGLVAAKTLILLRNAGAQPAQFSHGLPVLTAKSLFRQHRELTLIQRVLVTYETCNAVAQQLLFLGQIEIHFFSPNTFLAITSLCTSDAPP